MKDAQKAARLSVAFSEKLFCCSIFFPFFPQTVFMDLGTKIDFHHLKHLSKCPI